MLIKVDLVCRTPGNNAQIQIPDSDSAALIDVNQCRYIDRHIVEFNFLICVQFLNFRQCVDYLYI